ncbi:RNA-binding S4 domain-containing protein [Prosthecobacter dejongeii]|uniref:Ribosome-associated heat shock protein Hsp15 n=1 Tax=Prosthecobacter dejongeii TaxID=48465 RepID=A0A7W7YJJ6_9BACT|nr:S4 domain-containing protein [Prosthecobacter dejongeii]MBB5037267.1 ribosome-associated heat shock protein Hsp15 [Prosthecobacter dejongeii]
MSEAGQTQRTDKWLHHVRIFKTRSLATAACTKGQVTFDGHPVKPARDLHVGDVLEVVRGDLRLRLRVLAFAPRRLSASQVPEFYDNQTPIEWIQKAAELRRQKELETPHAHEMVTKPNKQQLRQLREWQEQNHSM